MQTINTLYVDALLGSIPIPLVFGKRFNYLHVSKLVDIGLTFACFHKGDEERQHDVEGR